MWWYIFAFVACLLSFWLGFSLACLLVVNKINILLDRPYGIGHCSQSNTGIRERT
jgi:hypothetical protein